jgi:DNA-binding transcriptional regulator YiaG
MSTELKQFKQWRKREKITQFAAAVILGVSVDTVRKWEQGRNEPSPMAKQAILSKCN